MQRTECIDTFQTAPLTWKAWVRAGIWLVERELLKAAGVVADWSQRVRTRRQLMTLDHRMMSDIGIGRAEAEAEFDKPFWRP